MKRLLTLTLSFILGGLLCLGLFDAYKKRRDRDSLPRSGPLETCPICRGECELLERRRDGTWAPIKCPECNGTGKVVPIDLEELKRRLRGG